MSTKKSQLLEDLLSGLISYMLFKDTSMETFIRYNMSYWSIENCYLIFGQTKEERCGIEVTVRW